MSAPTFAKLNGQIKTAWRWYDAHHKLAEAHPSCVDESNDLADPPCVLSMPDHLPPFQFARPTSIAGITSWKLYDAAGVEVVDLAANIGNIDIQRFTTYDYVIYPGTILAAQLDPGLYYSRIITGGATYYSEPIRVVCAPLGDNCFPTDWAQSSFQTNAAPDNYWAAGDSSFVNYANYFTGVAGAPSNPAWESEGKRVMNVGDNLLYTYTGGIWVSSSPASGWWFLLDGGFYWYFTAGAWAGGGTPPNSIIPGVGIYFYPGVPLGVRMNIGNLACTCNDNGPVRMEFTVSDATAGTLTIRVEGVEEQVISGNGTFTFASFFANGYIMELVPSADFDGGVTGIRFFCIESADQCFRRLTWANCGNIGNTYFEGGFTDELVLDLKTFPMLPTPSTRVESEEQADGTVVETFRRKDVRFTMRLGLVPWPIADALSDMQMADTVRLYHLEGDGYDTLRDVQVAVTYDEAVSECMPQVEVSFRIDNSATACCDEFDRPCLVPCVDAEDFLSNVGLSSTGDFLDDNVCRYMTYDAGNETGRFECTSGAANIKVDEVEAIPKADNLQTYLWDPGLAAWVAIGIITDVDTSLDGSDCLVYISASLMDGYSATLQYYTGLAWVDATYDQLTEDEWVNNGVPWTKEAGAQYIRLKVMAGDCEVGFTAAWPSIVTCS